MLYAIMKKSALALLLSALFVIQGCSGMKEIRVVSCRPESVSMHGLRGMQAVLSVEVDNPARTISISDIEGALYAGDQLLGHFTSGSVTLEGRVRASVPVSVDFVLDKSVSIIGLLSMARSLDPDDITMDLSLKAKIKGGVSKKVRLEKVPVVYFMGDAGFLKNLDGIRNMFL